MGVVVREFVALTATTTSSQSGCRMSYIDSLLIARTLSDAGLLAFHDTIRDDGPTILASIQLWETKFIEEHAPSTCKAVRSDWLRYTKWCQDHNLQLLPTSSQTLASFLCDTVSQNYKLATISRYIYTLRRVHLEAALPDPVKSSEWPDLFTGIKQQLAARVDSYGRLDDGNAKKSAVPLGYGQLEAILSGIGSMPRDLRDAAMLHLASNTLLKAHQLVRVCVEDFVLDNKGDWWLKARGSDNLPSKDPYSRRFVSSTAMKRIRHWTSLADIREGPIFLAIGGRSRKDFRERRSEALHALRPAEVSRIFKQRAKDAGVPDAELITSHSLRLGSLADLANEGVNPSAVSNAGGWRQTLQVSIYMMRYLNAKKPVR